MQERIKIPTPSGKNIAAVIYRPNTETEKLAILCPGYLDSKDYDHLVKLADALAERGFTTVRFDPIGTWESDGTIEDYTGENYLSCIRSVKNYMREKNLYRFILLGGHSRGGRMSIIYASSETDISYVIGIMPSARSMVRDPDDKEIKEGKRSRRDLPGSPNSFREYIVPPFITEDSIKYDAIAAAPNVHAPILLIAGEKDTLIPLAEVQGIYNAANEPKKLVVIPNIGHDYRHNLDEIKIVNDKILESL